MRRNLIALSVLALMALGSPASAQWGTGGAQLNLQSQSTPVFVADGTGGVRDFSISENEIFESGITVDGTKLWALQYGPNTYPTQITGGADGTKLRLCAAADGLGGNVMAWSDTRTGGVGTYVQHVDANGLPTWTYRGIAVRLSSLDGAEIAICGDGAGGAIVAYQPKVGATNPKFPLFLQHVRGNGSLSWGTGVAVTNLAGSDAREIRLIPDDSGGVIATWIDLGQDRGVGDLYTQRVDATGVPLWGAGGVAVASVSNTIEHTARVVPDGSGGAYYVWEDNRLGYGSIHSEHVNAHGAGRWLPGFGVLVSSNESYRPQLARDPVSGDVFYGYVRPGFFGGPSHVAYARVSSTGSTVWTEENFGLSYGDTVAVAADGVGGVAFAYHDPYYGVYVSRVANDLTITSSDVKLGVLPAEAVFVVGDGRGGAVVAWRGVSADGYFSNTDYAQRLTLNGTLGQVLPNITKVLDVTNDEGGFVRVQVGAAGADVLSPYDATYVTGYGLWRRIEQASLAPQAALAPADVADRVALISRMHQGTVRLQPEAAALIGLPPGAWESLGLYPAAGLSSYSFLAATRQDSTASGRHREVFVVTAHTSTNGLVGLSFADSGSSVDNLAPPPPSNLAGQFSAGALHLSWSASLAADLAKYAIYRGSTSGFVPSPGSLLGYASSTAFTDGAFVPGSYYKVTALDRHGNESAWATLAPTTDVSAGNAPMVSFLAPVQPNPMRGGAVVSFGLARGGEAELAVFDLSGRRVCVLAQGLRDAGAYHIRWDGRDEQGRPLPRGLFWLRLTAPGIRATQKVVRAD